MTRYIRNENMLSPEENLRLRGFHVAVVGCGGLGGHIIEMLARLGIGHITAIDADVFEPSNLNRQLFSRPSNLGQPKALEAEKHIQEINPDIKIKGVYEKLTQQNALSLLKGHDIICDALDNVSSRRILQDAAEDLNVPMIYAAIAGWYAQICTIMPGDRMLDKIYFDEKTDKGAETQLGNPSFTPALAASIQVAECMKVLLQKKDILQHKMLVVDLLHHHYEVVEL